jgi:epoxyqueuosine reductase QueG
MVMHGKPDSRRIVVIGPCASGKTTLVARLKDLGYDAHACGQEHSEITELWRHLNPAVVIGLQIDLDTLRQRRSATWSDRLYARQLTRLESGYDRADMLIDCDTFNADEVIRQVVDWLVKTHAA